MATKSYRPSEFWHIADGAEVKRGHINKIATEQLIPRIALRNQIAVETIETELYFFQAIRAGRRCSCFNIETSPDSLCLACFGTGIVGGFQKFGTHVESIDITYPNIRSTNVVPDYSKRTKPVRFVLVDGATSGNIEARIYLKSNIGKVDALPVSSYMPPGTELGVDIRSPADPTYVPLTYTSFAQRLVNPWVDIRVRFNRISKSNESPKLDVIHLRYHSISDPIISANIPRAMKSIMLQEIGIVDDWQTMNFWFDNRLKSITTEDFLISKSGNTRWKLVSVKDFAPHGQLVSWDCEGRLVQPYEPYSRIPLGAKVE